MGGQALSNTHNTPLNKEIERERGGGEVAESLVLGLSELLLWGFERLRINEGKRTLSMVSKGMGGGGMEKEEE